MIGPRSIAAQKERRMARMGKYCKAYFLKDLRAFGHWKERAKNARTEKRVVDGEEKEVARELTDDAYLFLQENYVVTDGIFMDEHVIFDAVNDEWKRFCREELGFEMPKGDAVPPPAEGSDD
jgi:hypothetical protein